MKETTIKAYFWHGSGYNAVIFTDGNRRICFDETFEDIDLMGPAVGENFDNEFPADELTFIGIVEE